MDQKYPPPAAGARWAARFVLAAWAGMTAAAAGFVLHFGRNAPWADEWEMVPGLVGDVPLSEWLWAQHNEHRLPLPRLCWWALFQVVPDFRAGMVAQVAVLSATALGLMRTAARLRGRVAYADAFLPVGLLHWGHVENLVMGYQVCFALTAALACGLLVAAVTTTPANRARRGLLAGGLLVGLELTGGSGLPFVPPVSLWLLGLAWAEWRAGRRRAATLLIALAVAAVGYVGLYLRGYVKPPLHPPPSWGDPFRVVAITAQVLAMAVGPAVIDAWGIAAAAVGLVLAGAAAHLAMEAVRDPANRGRTFGLLAVLAGVAGLAVAIGVGRSGFRGLTMGLWSRYALLAWPGLAVAYLAAAAAGRRGRRAVLGLAAAMLLTLPRNTEYGREWAADYAKEMDQLEADVREGCPPAEVIRRGRYLSELGRDAQITAGIGTLKRAGVSYFGGANVLER